MNILVINAGSSSLKYQLVDIDSNKVLARGLCERVGSEESFHKHGIDENEVVHEQPLHDHTEAMQLVLKTLVEDETVPLSSLEEIGAVGHRIVHGGEHFKKSAMIDDDVIAISELRMKNATVAEVMAATSSDQG